MSGHRPGCWGCRGMVYSLSWVAHRFQVTTLTTRVFTVGGPPSLLPSPLPSFLLSFPKQDFCVPVSIPIQVCFKKCLFVFFFKHIVGWTLRLWMVWSGRWSGSWAYPEMGSPGLTWSLRGVYRTEAVTTVKVILWQTLTPLIPSKLQIGSIHCVSYIPYPGLCIWCYLLGPNSAFSYEMAQLLLSGGGFQKMSFGGPRICFKRKRVRWRRLEIAFLSRLYFWAVCFKN